MYNECKIVLCFITLIGQESKLEEERNKKQLFHSNEKAVSRTSIK